MQGRRTERKLIRSRAVLIAFLLLGPGAAGAQQRAPKATFEAGTAVRATRLRGGTSYLAGGSAQLAIHDRFSFGGAGWVLLGASALPGATPSSDLEFRVAYGGVYTEFRILGSERRNVSVGALMGAGNGKVTLPAVGTQIAADNFGVVEPDVSADLALFGRLHARLTVGYRATFGVEDLPGISATDLRGYVAGVGLTIRPF